MTVHAHKHVVITGNLGHGQTPPNDWNIRNITLGHNMSCDVWV